MTTMKWVVEKENLKANGKNIGIAFSYEDRTLLVSKENELMYIDTWFNRPHYGRYHLCLGDNEYYIMERNMHELHPMDGNPFMISLIKK